MPSQQVLATEIKRTLLVVSERRSDIFSRSNLWKESRRMKQISFMHSSKVKRRHPTARSNLISLGLCYFLLLLFIYFSCYFSMPQHGSRLRSITRLSGTVNCANKSRSARFPAPPFFSFFLSFFPPLNVLLPWTNALVSSCVVPWICFSFSSFHSFLSSLSLSLFSKFIKFLAFFSQYEGGKKQLPIDKLVSFMCLSKRVHAMSFYGLGFITWTSSQTANKN